MNASRPAISPATPSGAATAAASTAKLLLTSSSGGDEWRLTLGKRNLGAYSSLKDAMAAVTLFSRQLQAVGRSYELVIEEELLDAEPEQTATGTSS
jgi:hypothetical protein